MTRARQQRVGAQPGSVVALSMLRDSPEPAALFHRAAGSFRVDHARFSMPRTFIRERRGRAALVLALLTSPPA